MPLLELSCAGGATFALGAAIGRYLSKDKEDNNNGRSRARTNTFWAGGIDDAIVVVDAFSTGSALAAEAQKRGYKLIHVISSDWPQNFLEEHARSDVTYETTILFNKEDPAATVKQIKDLKYHIISILIGAESGVECFDALTSKINGFPTNALELAPARRDKYLMGERVRSAGLRAVKQKECRSWGDAAEFVTKTLGLNDGSNGRRCVLKPTKSAGSDGVYVAKSVAEAQEFFGKILGAATVFLEVNQTVLVQEFLKGQEYVVDSVSVEGDHKCVAIWEYDKRPCNGAPFVYYGMKLYQSENGNREAVMVKYMHDVLNALGVRHGPSHGEVMWLEDEDQPCLVEVGCRPHGGDGTFMDLVEPIIGYSQVSVMIDAVEKPYRFRRLPARPVKFEGLGLELMLVSHVEGLVNAFPLLNTVKRLPSFKTLMMKLHVNSRIEKTVDFMTTPGSIMLVHSDRRQVLNDYEFIHKMCANGSFYILSNSTHASPKFNVKSM